MVKPRSFKCHFNRVNMQRGKPEVWTVHTSTQCIQVTEVDIRVPVKTVFRPTSRQPRAWFSGRGTVTVKGNRAIIQ